MDINLYDALDSIVTGTIHQKGKDRLTPATQARVMLALLWICDDKPSESFSAPVDRLRDAVAPRKKTSQENGLKPAAIGKALQWLQDYGLIELWRATGRSCYRVTFIDVPESDKTGSPFARRFVGELEGQGLDPVAHMALARLSYSAQSVDLDKAHIFNYTLPEVAEIAGVDRKTMKRILDENEGRLLEHRTEPSITRPRKPLEYTIKLIMPKEEWIPAVASPVDVTTEGTFQKEADPGKSAFAQRPVAQIPWGQTVESAVAMKRVDARTIDERLSEVDPLDIPFEFSDWEKERQLGFLDRYRTQLPVEVDHEFILEGFPVA